MWVALFMGTGLLMCLYSMEWYARLNCPTVQVNFLSQKSSILPKVLQERILSKAGIPTNFNSIASVKTILLQDEEVKLLLAL